ncbi:MAG: replication initiation protein [Malazfec virus 7]
MACYFPFKLPNPNYVPADPNSPVKIPVPCGKCPYCLQRRANNWVFRCMQHLQASDSGHWVTLTYDQPPRTETNLMTLRKRCFQLFMKRLRRALPGKDIKYYACGEYGDTYNRPHFHAVIFNATPEAIESAWTGYHETVKRKSDRYTIVNGYIKVDVVNENTVMYTAKYMNKGKLVGKSDWDNRVPEFQLFSKELGKSYLTPEKIAYHQQDPSLLFSWQNGHKIALPRYFKDKIYDEEAKKLQCELAQAKSLETIKIQEQEFTLSRSFNQTFEQFRFGRKNAALAAWKSKTSERNKFK